MYCLGMAKSLHTPEYEFFRSLLVQARTEQSRTQSDIALKLNLPQSFVAKYERGERRLDVVEFLRVCNALDTDPHHLIRLLSAEVGK